jgi:DNA-binding transcriptional ArsR family regulator
MTSDVSAAVPSDPEGNDPAAALRELTDPKTLRALTHPVRLALLEALALEGPLTATQAGELIDESPTTCSFHFRQLAKYGFVEEAGSGPGRQRPWKIAHTGMRFSDVTDDPEMSIAAKGLERMVFDRAIGRFANFLNARSSYSKEWQESAQNIETILWVTPEELRDVTAQVLAIVNRFRDRVSDPLARPEGSLAVEALMLSYPVKPFRSDP